MVMCAKCLLSGLRFCLPTSSWVPAPRCLAPQDELHRAQRAPRDGPPRSPSRPTGGERERWTSGRCFFDPVEGVQGQNLEHLAGGTSKSLCQGCWLIGVQLVAVLTSDPTVTTKDIVQVVFVWVHSSREHVKLSR